RSAVGIEVAFVLYRFISVLFVAKVQTTVLRVGEIVLSNPHVLRAGVVKPRVEDVCAAGRAGNDRQLSYVRGHDESPFECGCVAAGFLASRTPVMITSGDTRRP